MQQIVVYNALVAKFSQNEILKKTINRYKKCHIGRIAVQDKIWGIGLSIKDNQKYDRKRWERKNLLGYSLMCVRKEMKMIH